MAEYPYSFIGTYAAFLRSPLQLFFVLWDEEHWREQDRTEQPGHVYIGTRMWQTEHKGVVELPALLEDATCIIAVEEKKSRHVNSVTFSKRVHSPFYNRVYGYRGCVRCTRQ
jgi:hypothetical protein